MTTEKQSISRHKSATTRLSTSPGQSFDIIPPEKVRPSSSSRPVIVSKTPPVVDNTLRSDVDVPQLNLRHATPTLAPPREAAKPEEQGVLLADLVAKREKPEMTIEPTPESEKPVAQNADIVASAEAREPTEDVAQEAKLPDDKAVAEEPEADSLAAVLKSSHDEEAALQQQPGEHSESLKEAMNNMDEKDGRPHHELYGGKPVIVVHKDHHMSATMWVVWFVVCVGIALIIVDLLLDAGVITTNYVIPHTNFL